MLATILLMSPFLIFEVCLDLNIERYRIVSERATNLRNPSPFLLEAHIPNVNFKMAQPGQKLFRGVNIPTFVYLFLTNNK